MSKNESSSDKEAGSEVAVDDTEDAVQFDDSAEKSGKAEDSVSETTDQAEESAAETSDQATDSAADQAEDLPAESTAEKPAETGDAATEDTSPQKSPPEPRARRSWFGLFNFLLILALGAAAGYYWWLEQRVKRQYQDTIADLRAELAGMASNARVEAVDGSLASVRSDLGKLQNEIGTLDAQQEDLRAASEKLYELYGRDKNDWQLAEVEYLMRVAQHKLILQDDFEGAAITLQAASDKIALTADPGLLPVRVKISEEIADLKTRKRADLVGMTLVLAQLARQARVLEPGFERRVDEAPVPAAPEPEPEGDLIDRVSRVVDSLVTIRFQGDRKPTEVEASVVNIGETLEDNLKLARWSVLERDAFQYRKLIDETVRLFREFYDLDNAANSGFLDQLLDLQKMQLKPEKPDIGGSLRELQRILSQRENAPAEAAPAATESADG